MSALERYDEAIELLGTGNEVGVAEMLKRDAVVVGERLAAAIEAEPSPDLENDMEGIEAFLVSCDEATETFLAAAFPAIEYGSKTLHAVLVQALTHVASKAIPPRGTRPVGVAGSQLAIGRLTWAMATQAVGSGRLDVFKALATVRVPLSETNVEHLLSWRRLRYPDAFGQHATAAYANYKGWLESRAVISEKIPLLATHLASAIEEADVLLALLLIARGRSRAYSEAADGTVVRRVGLLLRESPHRADLAAAFGVAETELDDTVNHAYANGPLEYNRDRVWDDMPASLIGASD